MICWQVQIEHSIWVPRDDSPHHSGGNGLLRPPCTGAATCMPLLKESLLDATDWNYLTQACKVLEWLLVHLGHKSRTQMPSPSLSFAFQFFDDVFGIEKFLILMNSHLLFLFHTLSSIKEKNPFCPQMENVSQLLQFYCFSSYIHNKC